MRMFDEASIRLAFLLKDCMELFFVLACIIYKGISGSQEFRNHVFVTTVTKNIDDPSMSAVCIDKNNTV